MKGASPHVNGHATRTAKRDEPYILVIGGAGFIGTNLASRFLDQGQRVVVYDSLARPGVEANAAHLRRKYAELVDIRIEDVRDRKALRASIAGASAVAHLAAQVAVTTSLEDPEEDLRINVLGTMAVLECLRHLDRPVSLLFTSTNKVYGNLPDIELRRAARRYEPVVDELRLHGVNEKRPLDFHSPYGCSKGAADQYILDYARSYHLPTCVFRMSCIYGPHQCGTEDQGWVAHFLKSAIHRDPVTIYGDGRQVRDALHVNDLVDAFQLALSNMDRVRGHAFNIGGGPANTLSLMELLDWLGTHSFKLPTSSSAWRRGDQRWYVSDTRAFQNATGWRPRVSIHEGLANLLEWLSPAPVSRGAAAPASKAEVAQR